MRAPRPSGGRNRRGLWLVRLGRPIRIISLYAAAFHTMPGAALGTVCDADWAVIGVRRSIPLQCNCSESSPRALPRRHHAPSSLLSTRRRWSTSPAPSRCRPRSGRSHCRSGAHSRRWRDICRGTPLWRLHVRRSLKKRV